ncbi:hypothetical protein FRC11_004015, partial [Ceratobasidium sp. 423]
MSTAVPLPALGDLFGGDEATRNAYARLLSLENQAEVSIRVLGQLLLQAPTLEGRAFMAQCINN